MKVNLIDEPKYLMLLQVTRVKKTLLPLCGELQALCIVECLFKCFDHALRPSDVLKHSNYAFESNDWQILTNLVPKVDCKRCITGGWI